jgi:hypothetical protein
LYEQITADLKNRPQPQAKTQGTSPGQTLRKMNQLAHAVKEKPARHPYPATAGGHHVPLGGIGALR